MSSMELDQKGAAEFWRIYDERHDEIQEHLLQQAREMPDFARVIDRMSADELEESDRRSRALMKDALLNDEWGPLEDHQREEGATYAAMGIPFRHWGTLVRGFKTVIRPYILDRFRDDPERLIAVLEAMAVYVDRSISVIGEGYLAAKERIISQQQSAIQELSTPVLQIKERMLLVPLVGVLDTERARHLTEQLLQAIRSHRAQVIVIDITGVPAVDSRVANHLLQTVAAARLMGARSIVTGLSANVAQALVRLGVNTSELHTVGDLQEGLVEAERLSQSNAPGADHE